MSAKIPSRPPETVAEQFIRAHRDFADNPALLCNDRWWSYAEVEDASRRMTRLLADCGARPGDRIVLFLENCAVLRIIEHSILTTGLVRVALSPRLHVKEVASIAQDCTAAVICCSPKHETALREAVAEIGSMAHLVVMSDDEGGVTPAAISNIAPADLETWPRPTPTDAAMLMYSSGTTGMPKGAVVRHSAWIAQTRIALARLPVIGVGDVVLAVAPMAHFGGSIGLNCVARGAATVTLAAFDVVTTLEYVVEHGVTVLPLAPIMLKRLIDEAPPTLLQSASETLRAIPYGGAPTDTATLVASATRFPKRLVQFYGLSETLAPVASLSAADHDAATSTILGGGDASCARRILESAGRPPAEVELRFRAEDDSGAPTAGNIGEIVVRSPMVTAGYWNRPELTAAALDPDGWFATGDLGELDAEGYLHLLNRKNDVIISGGYNVYPGEVERVIGMLECIDECVVIGIPHPRWGEGVHALVVLERRPGWKQTETPPLPELTRKILELCRRHLAAFKKPVSIEVVPVIPRTSAGKVDRKRLLAEYLDRQAVGGDDRPSN